MDVLLHTQNPLTGKNETLIHSLALLQQWRKQNNPVERNDQKIFSRVTHHTESVQHRLFLLYNKHVIIFKSYRQWKISTGWNIREGRGSKFHKGMTLSSDMSAVPGMDTNHKDREKAGKPVMWASDWNCKRKLCQLPLSSSWSISNILAHTLYDKSFHGRPWEITSCRYKARPCLLGEASRERGNEGSCHGYQGSTHKNAHTEKKKRHILAWLLEWWTTMVQYKTPPP